MGRTAVDDLDGNALLWALGTVAYLQLRHDEPLRGRLLLALRRIARLRAPRLAATG